MGSMTKRERESPWLCDTLLQRSDGGMRIGEREKGWWFGQDENKWKLEALLVELEFGMAWRAVILCMMSSTAR